MITMVTMGGDLQPGCLVDRLLTALGQPQVKPKLRKKEKKCSVLLNKEIMNTLVVDLLQQKQQNNTIRFNMTGMDKERFRAIA